MVYVDSSRFIIDDPSAHGMRVPALWVTRIQFENQYDNSFIIDRIASEPNYETHQRGLLPETKDVEHRAFSVCGSFRVNNSKLDLSADIMYSNANDLNKTSRNVHYAVS